MAGSQLSPLTEEDYQKINTQLGNLARLQQEIQLAAQAGCAVGDKSEACQRLTQQLSEIKRVYFPDRP
jgi:hypothetical protein